MRVARRDSLKTGLKNGILALEAQKIDFYKEKSLENGILSTLRFLKNGLKKRDFGSCCEKKTGLKNGLFAISETSKTGGGINNIVVRYRSLFTGIWLL